MLEMVDSVLSVLVYEEELVIEKLIVDSVFSVLIKE